MADFIFRGNLADLDPDVYQLTQLETERQYRKLIMIPSESLAPLAVRQALGSVFQNIYAEGYPDEDTRKLNEADILDYPLRLSNYRRYADPRYYKGVEYADVIEELARRRCAELFATPSIPANNLFVNVQPLSGAPANNAVYTALLNPGDTILGMNLLHGGHLSHGSSVNRSGKLYKAVHYGIDAQSEQINYDAVQAVATEHKPKIIIAGYSSYPWVPDWARFRAIADSVGAILLADISHIAGMIAAGIIPSPVGHAQIITFTTHKTLCGPRGACILTSDSALARKLDRAVFPGEQGGPHVHVFAALALTFKLARTSQFKQLQTQIIKNCIALTGQLKERGLRIPFGGTNTHLTNIDCKSVTGPSGATLSGDMAARILDVAGLVVNRNTIPGDITALNASGIRLGTPWVTQRGLVEADMLQIADAIADTFNAITPYEIETHGNLAQRAKVNFDVLEDVRLRLRALAARAGMDEAYPQHGYPHFYYIDDQPSTTAAQAALDITGELVRSMANYCFSSDIEALSDDQSQPTQLFTPRGVVDGSLACIDPMHFRLTFPANQFGLVATWLRDISDGYVAIDADPARRIPGPVIVSEATPDTVTSTRGNPIAPQKPYYIGIIPAAQPGAPLPEFSWHETESTLHKTPLNEHLATRQAAGLFDVAHMGVFQAEGIHAVTFLDSVCANDIAGLAVGESCYTHFMDPDANVIDDTLVYRRGESVYMVVVNASNDSKDWAWLNAVREGQVLVDRQRPWARAFGTCVNLRNLRDPKEGADQRVDIALQGPRSRDILLALGCDLPTRKRVQALKRTELCPAVIGGFDLVVSRTGYTGEKMAFELFIHPDQAVLLWNALLKAGQPLGLKPCGLGARDSLRTEAGLPLYGHEMGGDLGLGVAEAGFGSYVKTYKPWFVGRQAYIAREANRTSEVTRFRFTEKGVRMAHTGDPVLDKKGLTGQVFIENKYAEEGAEIAIFQGASKSSSKAPAELKYGDRVTLPTPAVILSRFPK
jgi:glycine hydroxymethyltransferase